MVDSGDDKVLDDPHFLEPGMHPEEKGFSLVLNWNTGGLAQSYIIPYIFVSQVMMCTLPLTHQEKIHT